MDVRRQGADGAVGTGGERRPRRPCPAGHPVQRAGAREGEAAPRVKHAQSVQPQSVHRAVEAVAQRVPRGAVPTGDAAGGLAAGGGEVAGHVDVAVRADGHRISVVIQAASERIPARAVPTRRAVRYHAAGGGKAPDGVQVAVAAGIHGEPEHGTVHACAEPLEARAIPTGDAIGRLAAGRGEGSADENVAGKVDGQRVDLAVRTSGHRLPGGTVPPPDAAHRHPTRGDESTAGNERAIGSGDQRQHPVVDPAAKRVPVAAVEADDVVGGDAVHLAEAAADEDLPHGVHRYRVAGGVGATAVHAG